MNMRTVKTARYTGRGTPLYEDILGKHSEGHFFFPAWLQAAIMAGKWVAHVWCADYSAASFTETKENSGTIAMSAGGLLFTTGAADGNSCNIQALRAVTLAASKKALFFARLAAGDVTNSGVVFGAHVTDADYYDTVPTHQAVFNKAKGAGVVVGTTKDGTTASDTATLFTAEDAVAYDLAVLINPGVHVQFLNKAITTEVWTKTTKTTNLPAAGQSMRLSLNIENNTSGSGETLTAPFFGMAWEV